MSLFDFKNLARKYKELEPRRKRIVLALALLGVILLILLMQFVGSMSFVFSGGSDIIVLTNDIKKLQTKLQLAQEELAKIKQTESEVMRKKNDYWIPDKDSNINAVIQNKVQTIATECQVEMRSTGTIQINTVAEGINSAQFDISCAGDMKAISNFIYKLSTTNPKMYWDRTSLRSDDVRNNSKLYFGATLMFLCVENKMLQGLFTSGGETSAVNDNSNKPDDSLKQ